ncbi:PLP-dependent aminotransferase family protein [Leucobacter luti]|uniref:GntR family transcriptional regulator/MocR family aminotransferase n=1 Tax=Leucobacter luti TaxID=340320 RepID=A0A4Q7TUA2_9MICO|nr:PLP-dependent aminotransferase family protein [Leucobacter luti]MBL3698376.1 PLP-dependent aminotransferase family protein [Leucobacter luti]RZT64536.1 GntR family transcriptional regulator/MocR family aminotransferase [Leucobacter luti]
MSEVGVAAGGFPVQLDRAAEASLPVQLAAALREAIDAATLRPGEQVPATRELARRLGVARGVVVVAYEQLIAEGYLAASHGRGTRVNPALELTEPGAGQSHAGVAGAGPTAGAGGAAGGLEAASAAGSRGVPRPEAPTPGTGDPAPERAAVPDPLAPGQPITDSVVGPAWRSAWREAAARVDVAPPALGDPALRRELAEHLRRMRGTARAASDVLVTAGTRDGLGLLLTALGGTRGRELVVGVEDPGLPSLRGAAQRFGARIVALPTDAEGLDTRRLPEGLLDAVIVTPSHQYPLGGSLPLPRRRELLAWARRTGVVVVEDDFDSELRYTGSALPTLAALDDPERGSVVLLGTFSRTIAPGLAAGYLLAPAGLRARLEPLRRELGGPVSGVVQAALARYLASGELRRHTARMLRRYAARRDAVSDRLAGAAGVRVRPMDGGLHAVIEFQGAGAAGADAGTVGAGAGSRSGAAGSGASAGPGPVRGHGAGPGRDAAARESAVLAVARAEGLGVQGLASYWQRPDREPGMAGLVLGMGGPDDAEFEHALVRLRAILDTH